MEGCLIAHASNLVVQIALLVFLSPVSNLSRPLNGYLYYPQPLHHPSHNNPLLYSSSKLRSDSYHRPYHISSSRVGTPIHRRFSSIPTAHTLCPHFITITDNAPRHLSSANNAYSLCPSATPIHLSSYLSPNNYSRSFKFPLHESASPLLLTIASQTSLSAVLNEIGP